MGKKRAKVLTFATNKGGTLKTSCTINIAGVWAKQGKKVLIIDMDNQADVAASFGLNPDEFEDTIYDVLYDGMAIEHTIKNVHKNLDIVPANDEFQFFEFDVLTNQSFQGKYFNLLKNAANHLRSEYDVILVDSPPTLSITMGNILNFVDHVIVPFQPELYSKRSLAKIINSINSMKAGKNPNINLMGILPVMVKSVTNLHQKNMKAAALFSLEHNYYFFESVIPNSIRYAEEIEEKQMPATLSLPRHELVKVYFELAKEIEKLW